MNITGVSKKTGLMITVGYVVIAYLISLLTSLEIGMIVISFGMMVAGFMGIKNNSYAFIKAEEMITKGKTMSGFITYMNWLLLFLGIVLIVQQF